MVCSSARRYSPPRNAKAKLVPSAEMPKPENIRRIVTGPKSAKRSIRKSRSMEVACEVVWMRAQRAPDAAQRHQRVYARLRRAMAVRCRAGAHILRDVVVGPGSAEQREERCTASGTQN